MKHFIVPLFIMFLCQTGFTQRVGVGTINPVERLHVAGNIKADTLKPNAFKLTTDAGAGKVLTSDQAGNGSWQTSSNAGNGVGFGSWGDCSMNGVDEYNPVADPDGALNDNGGYAVAISGNFAIVGADGDDCCGDQERGSICFYWHDGSKWVFMQKVIDAEGDAGDHFGISVAISGNYAIVGAYGDDCCGGTNQGSASIYQFNGNSWAFMQKITDPDGNNGDAFGCNVSISGNNALIGAYGDDGITGVDQGSALIFQLVGSSWVFKQKITDADGGAGDYFGTSVSISGNSIIVGAYADDISNVTDAGSASFYQFNGSLWIIKRKVTLSILNSHFGYSVSISGNYVVVGIPKYNLVNVNLHTGICFIYHYNGTDWVLISNISDFDSPYSKAFGYSVAISGNYLIVGDNKYERSFGPTTGAAYVYVRVGLGWQKVQHIKDPAGEHNDNFGYSTAIDGQRFLIGAYGFMGSSGKSVFGKVN